jgi:capsular exopolysaccharide synthesis family protein
MPFTPVKTDSAAASPVEEGGTLRQFLTILRRRWRILLILWIGTVTATTIYTFHQPKIYRPQAMLEIRPETPLFSSENQDPALQASRDLWENYYRTQEAILTSSSLHAEALRALPEAIKKSYESLPDPVAAFSGQVVVEKVRSSFILKAGFLDPDREKATQIVNTLVSIYLEDANRNMRRNRTGAVAVLSKEALPAMRQEVEDAEKNLRDFQTADGFIDPQERYNTLLNSRHLIVDRITQIRIRQMQYRAQLDALKDLGADGGSGLYHPAFQTSKFIELLAQQQETLETELARERRELKDDHPTILQLQDQLKRVQTKITQAIQGMLRSYETDLIACEQEEKSANEEQKKIEKQMAELSQRVGQYKRLEAEVTTNRELYNAYIKKHGEEVATSGMGLGSVRVVEPATVPTVPFKPNIIGNLAIGVIVGLLVGTTAMFVSEQLDDRIRSAREVQVFLGLDVLAVVPRLDEGRSSPDAPFLLNEKSSIAEFETFRALRSEVTTRLENLQGSKVVAVLSPMSGEGKSTTTANLAKVLAMDGRKVLIFDADMRRPTMNPNFGSKEIPDLGSVLRGEADLRQAIRPSKISGVDIIGMAAGTSQAAELAGTQAFEETFNKLRGGYDYVIVDSAPVNQASESAMIARRCDAVVMVLRERRTSRGAAQASRRRLSGMGVRVLGAALNAVEGPENAYGYYGYYYSYYKPKEEKDKKKKS